jgi:hypothetical protein
LKTLQTSYPNVQFIPVIRDDMAEWIRCNLIGHIDVLRHVDAVGVCGIKENNKGINISSQSIYRDRKGRGLYEHYLNLFMDSQTGLLKISSKYVAKMKVFVHKAIGINFAVPNDRFNNFKRHFFSEEDKKAIAFDPMVKNVWQNSKFFRRAVKLFGYDAIYYEFKGGWLNIDDSLGVILNSNKNFTVKQEYGRNIIDRSLHYDLVCSPYLILNRFAMPGEILLDTEYTLHIGSAAKTKKLYIGFRT